MPAGSLRSFAASLQYRADRVPSSCQARPFTVRSPSRSREMRRRLTADGSSSLRMVSESCHHSPSTRPRRPSVSIALRSFWLIARTSAGVVTRVVTDGGQPEQVAWQLRTVRVDDKRAPDAERAAEQPSLEHYIVARRCLAGLGRI